jgi:hypothetical protein
MTSALATGPIRGPLSKPRLRHADLPLRVDLARGKVVPERLLFADTVL